MHNIIYTNNSNFRKMMSEKFQEKILFQAFQKITEVKKSMAIFVRKQN